MNVKQEGLGKCPKCGTPVMQAVSGQAVCFGCMADSEPKTGRTVVVTNETGDGIEGRVEVQEVTHNTATKVGPSPKPQLRGVTVSLTLDQLAKADALVVMLEQLHEALDSMPFSTMKDAKLVMAIQAGIEKRLKRLKGE